MRDSRSGTMLCLAELARSKDAAVEGAGWTACHLAGCQLGLNTFFDSFTIV